MALTVQDIRDMAGEKVQGQAKAGNRVSLFNNLRTNQKKSKQYYNLNYELKVYKNFEKIKLPSARKMVETFMSHMPLSNPVVEVIPFKDVNPYKKRAITQQDFADALIRSAMAQTDDPVANGAMDMAVRGEVFYKIVEDVEAREDKIAKRKGETDADYKDRVDAWKSEHQPIKIICPDPTTCYPSKDHTDCRPDDMLQIYNLTAGGVRELFPKWKSSKQDNVLIRIAEFWSPRQYCVLGDNDPLTDGVEDNQYGFTPYTHAYSGWGMRDEDNSPESKAVSLLFGAYALLLAQCRWYSYLDKAIAFASMPIYEAEGERADYEVAGKELTPEPGQVFYGGEGRKVTVTWAAPNLPAGIMQALGIADALLERGGQPSVLKGVAPKGVEAGYPMALMIGEARLQFGVALDNLQIVLARTLEMARLLVRDVIKDDVPVWGDSKLITLSPTDCEGAYRYNLKFDATTPEGQANRALVGQRLRAGGSISRETELKVWQSNKNPKKELNRMRAESLMLHPAIQRMMAVRAVREIEGEQEAAVVAQLMAEGEAGAGRKAESTGITAGGRPESELPEDVVAAALTGRRSPTQQSAEEIPPGAFK